MKIGMLRGEYSWAGGVWTHKSGEKPAGEWGESFDRRPFVGSLWLFCLDLSAWLDFLFTIGRV